MSVVARSSFSSWKARNGFDAGSGEKNSLGYGILIKNMYQLSRQDVIITWLLLVLLSGLFVALRGASSFYMSILSIFFVLTGTIALAIPSLILDIGETKEIQKDKNSINRMLSAIHMLDDEEILTEGEDEFEAMLNFLDHHQGPLENVSTISVDNKRLSDDVLVDGDSTGMDLLEISAKMHKYEKAIESDEQRNEEVQEKNWVLLGVSVYGLAIFFQTLSTILK